MRKTCSLLVALGVSCGIVIEVRAQTTDTPLQRLGNWFRPKNGEPLRTDIPPLPAAPRPNFAPQASRSGQAYETRGVIYLEEPTPAAGPTISLAPMMPPKAVASPNASNPIVPQRMPVGASQAPPTAQQLVRPMPAPVTKTPAAPVQTVQAPSVPAPALQAPAAAAPIIPVAATTTQLQPATRTTGTKGLTGDALVQRLTRLVSDACPQARKVKINFTAANEVLIELEARTKDECNTYAGTIFALPDLDPYRVNLKFTVMDK